MFEMKRTKRKKIDCLDLESIIAGVIKRHGWDAIRARQAANEYRKFLYLLMLNPKEMLVPWTDDLDLFWHEHILHTKRYAEDCMRLFGRFIDHDPTVPTNPAAEAKARKVTADAYQDNFRPEQSGPTSWLMPSAVGLAAIAAMHPAGPKGEKKRDSSCSVSQPVVASCGSQSPAPDCPPTATSCPSCSSAAPSCSGGGGGCGGGGS